MDYDLCHCTISLFESVSSVLVLLDSPNVSQIISIVGNAEYGFGCMSDTANGDACRHHGMLILWFNGYLPYLCYALILLIAGM